MVHPTASVVEGLVHSGITTEFLMSDLEGPRGASVKLATLLDRESDRRVQLQPDISAFWWMKPFLVVMD